MSAPIKPWKPTGLERTQEQLDESFRSKYWMFSIRYVVLTSCLVGSRNAKHR